MRTGSARTTGSVDCSAFTFICLLFRRFAVALDPCCAICIWASARSGYDYIGGSLILCFLARFLWRRRLALTSCKASTGASVLVSSTSFMLLLVLTLAIL